MKRVMILVTMTLLVIGSTFNAQPLNGNGMKMGMKKGNGATVAHQNGNRLDRMQALLNLTDDQKAKISDLRFEHEQMAIETRSEIQKNRLVVRKMMTDNKIDNDKLLKITKENNELHGKIKLSRTTMWLDVYTMLDDTQKEQWTKTFGKFMKNGNGKKNHKHGMHGSAKNGCGKSQQRRMR